VAAIETAARRSCCRPTATSVSTSGAIHLTFASSGTGALIHLTDEMFKQASGIDLTRVPYKGTTQIIPDILDGRICRTKSPGGRRSSGMPT